MHDRARVALYLRDLPQGPSVEEQLALLKAAASAASWEVTEVARDPARPVGPVRDRRPAFDRLVRDIEAGRLDCLAAAHVDALARSRPDLERTLSRLAAGGGWLHVVVGDHDTRRVGGAEGLFAAVLASASARRGMAVSSAVASGRATGKAHGRPKVSPEREEHVRALRLQGVGILRTAKLAGVAVSVVQRIDASMRDTAEASR